MKISNIRWEYNEIFCLLYCMLFLLRYCFKNAEIMAWSNYYYPEVKQIWLKPEINHVKFEIIFF